MQYTPDLPAKQKPWGKVWADPSRTTTKYVEEQNHPQHDPEDNFINYAPTRGSYDRTNNLQACKDGYVLQPLDSVAPEYSSQHDTIFYTEVEENGVTGFLERGNFLDRI